MQRIQMDEYVLELIDLALSKRAACKAVVNAADPVGRVYVNMANNRQDEASEFVSHPHSHRGAVSVTSAGGGDGKTTLAASELFSISTGHNVLGYLPDICGRTAYFLGEHGIDRFTMQIARLCEMFDVSDIEINDRLHIRDVYELRNMDSIGGDRDGLAKYVRPYTFLRKDGNVYLPNILLIDEISRYFLKYHIVYAVFDPINEFHEVDENSNADVRFLLRSVLGGISARTGCAIDCILHPPKGFAGQDVRSSLPRGAIEWRDSARSARSIARISDTEADALGLDERDRNSARKVVVHKSNVAMTPHVSWFSIPEAERGEVGVAEAWTPPTRISTKLTDDEIHGIQEHVRLGHDGKGSLWRENQQAGSKWGGAAVGRALGFDAFDGPKTRSRAKAILQELVRSGALGIEHRAQNGREVPYIVAGTLVRPGGEQDPKSG